jgi:hypothetical protein
MSQAEEKRTRKRKNKHGIFKPCPHICICCSEIFYFKKGKKLIKQRGYGRKKQKRKEARSGKEKND